MPAATHLLIIDPQIDFCDLPPDWCGRDPATGQPLAPALPVPGAHADMLRLADFIRSQAQALDEITVTLDSHHRWDVAHPAFWRRASAGATTDEVPPFTPITAAQVRGGDFAPRDPAALPRALAYLDALESAGRYTLMVWPPHCLIGSWGHGVHPAVQAALGEWETRRQRPVQAVFKGSNPWTEHYSALQAEVPDPADPDTGLNRTLLSRLSESGRLLVAGEAGSHCVRATVDHLLAHGPAGQAARVTLLTDAISPVVGFEPAQAEFLEQARRAGCRCAPLATALG